ncbi:MAG: transcription antitermination protein NusB [Mycoplasmataceae bacterium]|nr:transcription antitermination protein NusB [Mycoplasmataceae bacterium]
MSQEENNLYFISSNLKNNTQWKKRVNLFRLIYAFLQTNNSEQEIINNIDEDEIGGETFVEQRKILKNIIDNFDKYKEIINSNLKNWSFDRISDVDKALFLCALGEYNVLHTNKSIIIDQTLITAKRYSNPNAYKYINAILDKILK